MTRWIIIAVVLLAVIYRKQISAWLDSKGMPTDEDLPAGAKTGLQNLQSKIEDNPVFDELQKIISQLRASEQSKLESDLVDDQPIDQMIMNESDFMLLAKPQTSKIFARVPVDPQSATTALEKADANQKIKAEYLWWPEILHEMDPQFSYFNGSKKVFVWS